MAMLTTDSCLKIASSMFIHNIVNPSRKKINQPTTLFLPLRFLLYTLTNIEILYYAMLFLLAIDISNPTLRSPSFTAWELGTKEKAVLGISAGIIITTL